MPPVPKPNPVRPTPAAAAAKGGRRMPAGGFKGKTPPLKGMHLPQTVEWYKSWRTSPQAALFLDSDWQRLQMVALLVDRLYDEDTEPGKLPALLAEIRQNETKLGATLADRSSLYLTLSKPGEPDSSLSTHVEPARDVPPAATSRWDSLHVVADAG